MFVLGPLTGDALEMCRVAINRQMIRLKGCLTGQCALRRFVFIGHRRRDCKLDATSDIVLAAVDLAD